MPVICYEIFLILIIFKDTKVKKACEEQLNQNVNAENPWNSFVLTELQLAGNLFQVIHKTLVFLHTAIKDVDAMQPADKNMMIMICENQTPPAWRQCWSGPRMVTDFLRAVVSRGVEAEHRYQRNNNSTFGDSINFSAVFNLEAYLAALKLTNAR